MWYLNHLVSFGIALGSMYYACIQLVDGRKDKAQHWGASLLITFVMLNILYFTKSHWLWAPAVSMAIGFGKEVADRLNKEKQLFDWGDIEADLIGTGGVMGVYIFSFLFG